MACSLGFRVGLLLDQFFSDRRKKCYFFVNTDKIQSILELKETLVDKFSLPVNVQLMHNGFLLLDEDTVFVVREDEAIEVVPSSPICKKNSPKHRSKCSNLDLISENQHSKNDKKSTKSEVLSRNERSDDICIASVTCVSNSSPSKDQPKKKKKRKHEAKFENDQALDITADTHYLTPDVSSGIKFHSSPYSFMSDPFKNSAANEAKVHCSPHSFSFGSAQNSARIESKSYDSCEKQTPAPEKVNFQPARENDKEEELTDSSRSHKRKWKNEQNKLKYSGVAELIKQMQSSSGGPSVENDVEMVDAEIDDIALCPKIKRKRIRRRKKKNKPDGSSSINSTLTDTYENTISVENVVHQSKFQNIERIHKRFNSEENINSNLEFPEEGHETSNYEAVHESNIHSKLCNQISPLTPPSEHNSEDDVYKKLLDLKKLNKPAVFERARVEEINTIDDEDRHSNTRIEAEAISHELSKVDSNPEPMKLMDQFSYHDKSAMQFEQPSNVPRTSNNSDKDDALSSVENRRSDTDGSRKESCPVHIKKNICDLNLDKLDINNYPVIESTRENDILVFKTLKLGASLSPSLSSLILARVLDVNGNNLILFEILSGKEEIDFSKDESLSVDNKSSNPLISLKWTELYEPRLLYP